jgi:hypothetical protein
MNETFAGTSIRATASIDGAADAVAGTATVNPAQATAHAAPGTSSPQSSHGMSQGAPSSPAIAATGATTLMLPRAAAGLTASPKLTTAPNMLRKIVAKVRMTGLYHSTAALARALIRRRVKLSKS